jgi:hypothetical protein
LKFEIEKKMMAVKCIPKSAAAPNDEVRSVVCEGWAVARSPEAQRLAMAAAIARAESSVAGEIAVGLLVSAALSPSDRRCVV